MAVKNTLQLIEEARKNINLKYDMYSHNIDTIEKVSKNNYDLICNGFLFGYMQGRKAMMDEMKNKNH